MQNSITRIGLVEDQLLIAETLREGLTLSGSEVQMYSTLQACIAAILEARFQNRALPHDILISDFDLAHGAGAQALKTLWQYVSQETLSLMLIKRGNVIEREMFGDFSKTRKRVKTDELVNDPLFDISISQRHVTTGDLLNDM